MVYCVVFFFQAEDGIRDWSVTGVQTCALPISDHFAGAAADEVEDPRPVAELLRQWSTDHPEFQLDRKSVV